ncbi:hypothetical protein TSAR_010837 [Trichomalopsis sarcophagae]|uniref:Uncharacterized protein n=1 Tax=Trichomalopsis sarcophagae TaxID=543379 RepID=A0A232F372_9HYME|nr:hypothetical protein TSAR_010837 [Trichomalopsis sarcophagae]
MLLVGRDCAAAAVARHDRMKFATECSRAAAGLRSWNDGLSLLLQGRNSKNDKTLRRDDLLRGKPARYMMTIFICL